MDFSNINWIKVEAVYEFTKFLHRDHLFRLYELVSLCHIGLAVENLVANHEHDDVRYKLVK